MNYNKCSKENANIQTASCTNFVCKKCGSTEYEIKDKSNGTGIAHGLYCAKCGFWHKWLGKEELKQYATKESKDEIIAKLQSENAALRERLEKAVELPFYKAGYRKAIDVLEIADDLLHDLAMKYAERGHKDYFAVCENVHLKVILKLIAEMRQEVEI